MPRYRFTGWVETVLTGLSHAVNAELHREDHGQPDESTVVAQPGDEITTTEAYPHSLMVNVDTGKTDLEQPAPAAAVESKPAIESLSVPELREHAAANDIDLGDAKKKADILAAIAAHPTPPADPPSDTTPPSDPAEEQE